MFKQAFNKFFKKDSIYSKPSLINFSDILKTDKLYDNFLDLYEKDGLARKIVDCVVDDGMRQWIECDKSLLDELSRLQVREKFMDAAKIARLKGGAIVWMSIEDGQAFDKELKYDANNQISYIKKVHNLQVADIQSIVIDTNSINTDPFSKYFLLPTLFKIRVNTNVESEITIHRSRCIIFKGDSLYNNYNTIEEKTFGISVLKKVASAISNYFESLDAGLATQRDFVQVIFKIDNFIAQLSDNDGVESFKKRLQALNILKSEGNKNIFPIDASEEYLKHSSSVGGFADITDRITERVSAASGIPIAKLFGRTMGGLNSNGQSDMQQYYDLVRSWRNDQLQNAINTIVNIIFAQQDFDKSTNNTWEFSSLTAPTELEQAQIRKTYTEIDCMYSDRNAIDLRDAYKERFSHGKFHENIKINTLNNDELEADIADIDLMVDKTQIQEELKQKELESKLKDAESNL